MHHSFPKLDISHFFVFVFIYYFYNKFYFKNEKMRKSIVIVSLLFSLSLVLGYSLLRTNSTRMLYDGRIQVLKTCIKLIGNYAMIYVLIKTFYAFIEKIPNYRGENKFLQVILDEKAKICIPIILLLIWLPIIIALYPGMAAVDAIRTN